jgi:hypothetical protein
MLSWERDVPHASHKLSLFLVPSDPDWVPDSTAQDRILDLLIEKKAIDREFRASDGAGLWIEGGFYRFRFDRPPSPVMYGNRQGGYRVFCPSCGANLAADVGAVLEQWSDGGGRQFACVACEQVTSLEEWRFQPEARPGRFALVFTQVEGIVLAREASEWLARVAGMEFVPVWSRG